jgi:low affinity Fe/Cu permease
LVDAADAFNQLITLNQQIRSTLDNHNEQVTIASKSYEEYVAEIERAAKAAGYQIDAEGN